MNKAQEQAIELIKKAALGTLYSDGRTNPKEIKKFEVEEANYGRVFVTIWAGCPNDEGTMASLLCREYGLFAIGKRGGIKALDYAKGNKARAIKHPLIYGFRH